MQPAADYFCLNGLKDPTPDDDSTAVFKIQWPADPLNLPSHVMSRVLSVCGSVWYSYVIFFDVWVPFAKNMSYSSMYVSHLLSFIWPTLQQGSSGYEGWVDGSACDRSVCKTFELAADIQDSLEWVTFSLYRLSGSCWCSTLLFMSLRSLTNESCCCLRTELQEYTSFQHLTFALERERLSTLLSERSLHQLEWDSLLRDFFCIIKRSIPPGIQNPD